MTFGDLKFEPCGKCPGPLPGIPGKGFRRTIFYFEDRVVTRCNKCGEMETFEKEAPRAARSKRAARS